MSLKPFSVNIAVLNLILKRLHSINGKQVQQHKITRSMTELNTQNLPPGTYIFEYTLNNKMLESGKWILSK
ncbi:MAG: T9SS type A sorting domain-containing protein [Bacteroidota bacterium]|nr:T9SS type A sorting domain-containing protein [Bacteroidota bacterium]